MNKFVLLLTLAVLSSSAFAADYVSPNEYKNLTCDEMNTELEGLVVAGLEATSETIDYKNSKTLVDKIEYNRRSAVNDTLSARIDALTAAMDRKRCPAGN